MPDIRKRTITQNRDIGSQILILYMFETHDMGQTLSSLKRYLVSQNTDVIKFRLRSSTLMRCKAKTDAG